MEEEDVQCYADEASEMPSGFRKVEHYKLEK